MASVRGVRFSLTPKSRGAITEGWGGDDAAHERGAEMASLIDTLTDATRQDPLDAKRTAEDWESLESLRRKRPTYMSPACFVVCMFVAFAASALIVWAVL